MRVRSRRAAFGITPLTIAVLVALAPLAAQAHFRSHGDADGDVPDMRRVALRERAMDGEPQIAGKVVFSLPEYGFDEPGHVRVDFDSRGGPRVDRYAFITFDSDGAIYRSGLFRRGGRSVAEIRTGARWNDNTHVYTYRLRFAADLLRTTKHVRWRVIAGTFRCPDPACDELEILEDRAPDAGWYEH